MSDNNRQCITLIARKEKLHVNLRSPSSQHPTLMACGGGGGGGTENQVTDLTAPPSNQSPYAKERSQSLGLGSINAEAAYDRGWTGDGVTIGYYEIVIDGSHPELSGNGRQSLRRSSQEAITM